MDRSSKNSSARILGTTCLVLLAVLAFWKGWTLFNGSPKVVLEPIVPGIVAPPAPSPKLESRPALPMKSAQKPLVLSQAKPQHEIKKEVRAAPTSGQPIPPSPIPSPTIGTPPLPAPPTEPKEWTGNATAITHVGQIVVRNDRQWIHFWSEHRPHEAAPEVDFTKDMVLGVFAGPRPADPFSIRITDVRSDADKLLVYYRERLPPVGTFAVNVTVYPYFIKVYPQSNLKVKFVPQEPENVSR